MSIFGSMSGNFQLPSLLNLSKLKFDFAPAQQAAIKKVKKKQQPAAKVATPIVSKAQAESINKSIAKQAASMFKPSDAAYLAGSTPAPAKPAPAKPVITKPAAAKPAAAKPAPVKSAAVKPAPAKPLISKAEAKKINESMKKLATSLLGDTPEQRKIAAEQLQTGSAITPSMIKSLPKAEAEKLTETIEAVSQGKPVPIMSKAESKKLNESITKQAMSMLGSTPEQRKISAEQLQTGSAITQSMMESLSEKDRNKMAASIVVSQNPDAVAAKKTAIAAGIDPRVVDAKALEMAEKYGGLGAGKKQLEKAGADFAEAIQKERQTQSALAPVREQSQAAAKAAAKRIRRTSLVRFTPMSLTRQKGKGAVSLDEDDKSFFGSYL